MFWLKGCRRCEGDVYQGEDIAGKYLACIQCGHYLSDLETSQLMGKWPVLVPKASLPGERRGPMQAVA